jgi:hypothetical protein
VAESFQQEGVDQLFPAFQTGLSVGLNERRKAAFNFHVFKLNGEKKLLSKVAVISKCLDLGPYIGFAVLLDEKSSLCVQQFGFCLSWNSDQYECRTKFLKV